jgi:hypothetical protein
MIEAQTASSLSGGSMVKLSIVLLSKFLLAESEAEIATFV